MDARRSFYLASSKDDFAEPPADASRLELRQASTADRWTSRCSNVTPIPGDFGPFWPLGSDDDEEEEF